MKLIISKLFAFALVSANGIHGSQLRESIEESKARCPPDGRRRCRQANKKCSATNTIQLTCTGSESSSTNIEETEKSQRAFQRANVCKDACGQGERCQATWRGSWRCGDMGETTEFESMVEAEDAELSEVDTADASDEIDLDSSSNAGATGWYTNWDYCIQDCPESNGSCCGGTAESWDTTFSSVETCCGQSALEWNYDNCVTESTRCSDNDNDGNGRRRPSDGNRDSGPCSCNEIFSGHDARTRADMTRSARTGTLKQDYPEVWKDTKQERNQCKQSVGPNECKDMGLCGEAEFEEVKW